MAYDFRKLKTIHCFDAVTIRVPERWRCGPDHKIDGFWSCYEDGDETGTLWIHLDKFSRSDDTAHDLGFNARETVDELIEHSLKEFGPFLESSVTEVGNGYLWKRIYDDEEDGIQLRHTRYTFFQSVEGKAAVTDFNFVLPVSVIQNPEFRDLIVIMDREIRAVQIDPFSSEFTDNDYSSLGPLRRVNFGGQVIINLPGRMEARLEGGSGYQWYCYFEPDVIEARMWVMTNDIKLVDEDNRRETAIVEECFGDVLRTFIADENQGREISRVPGGALAYDTYDDPELDDIRQPADESDWRSQGLRNHLWRYLQFGNGRARLAQFLLMLPEKRAEAPPLPDLVRLLDREIRKTQFPGFELPSEVSK